MNGHEPVRPRPDSPAAVDRRGHRPGRPRQRHRPRRRLGFLISLAGVVTLIGFGCGGTEAENVTTVQVFAAASLSEVMVDLHQAFEAERRTDESAAGNGESPIDGESSAATVRVQLNLAGSSALRTQILEGAPADVVATANPEVMEQLAEADALKTPPRAFATNRLVLALAPGNPGRVASLDDLADPDLFVGLCDPEVPCGALADRALAAVGVEASIDSREPDVRALLAKIEAGELDAGLVYLTDLATAEGVVGIELPADLPAEASYPVAVVANSTQPEAAQAFVDFILGPTGQAILARRGFGPPDR